VEQVSEPCTATTWIVRADAAVAARACRPLPPWSSVVGPAVLVPVAVLV
jgi:hypothetical protein